MARSRSIIVAGAGIGGLTAALALARAGYRAVVLEQAERLDEAGAGIQLSPNATREIARIPLGLHAEQRYGAPYWVIHRADLQAVLVAAIEQSPDVTLRLGTRVEDFAVHQHGVTVQTRTAHGTRDEQGIALIGADGLWSALRTRLGERKPPRSARRTAWRSIVPAAALTPEFREPVTRLWLGRDAHLVHYPV